MTHLSIHVVAGVLIQRDGRILLVQEMKPEVYGKWNLPGGRVETGESLEAAARREAKEETGYEVDLDQALPIYHETAEMSVLHPFAAHIVGGELKIQDDEILAAKWFTPAEIRAMKADIRGLPYLFGSMDALGL